MVPRNKWLRIGLLLVVGALSFGAGSAQANPINPGFDFFSTPAGGSSVFIPGIGTVQLMGVPMGGALGNTDTIVQRMSGISPFDPPSGTGTIPIELVALNLQSVQPVTIGTNAFNVTVTLSPNAVSIGQMTVHHQNTNGGTFDSFFDVFVVITFTDVNNPTSSTTMQAQDHIVGSGTWTHTPPPLYPQDPNFPSGGFYPGPLGEQGTNFVHTVTPAQTPEPGTLMLLGLGLSSLAIKLRRKI